MDGMSQYSYKKKYYGAVKVSDGKFDIDHVTELLYSYIMCILQGISNNIMYKNYGHAVPPWIILFLFIFCKCVRYVLFTKVFSNLYKWPIYIYHEIPSRQTVWELTCILHSYSLNK